MRRWQSRVSDIPSSHEQKFCSNAQVETCLYVDVDFQSVNDLDVYVITHIIPCNACACPGLPFDPRQSRRRRRRRSSCPSAWTMTLTTPTPAVRWSTKMYPSRATAETIGWEAVAGTGALGKTAPVAGRIGSGALNGRTAGRSTSSRVTGPFWHGRRRQCPRTSTWMTSRQ